MSVEKVNKYKDKKYNRAEDENKREKLMRKIMGWGAGMLLGGGLLLAIVLGGVGAYRSYIHGIPDYNRTQMVVTDMTGILDTQADEANEAPAETK